MDGLAAKALWNRFPGVMECLGLQASCSHPALAFPGGPASASDIHSPVGEGRSQAHNMQRVPRQAAGEPGSGPSFQQY